MAFDGFGINSVRTTGNQTVGGQKTFTDVVGLDLVQPAIFLKNEGIAKGTSPTLGNNVTSVALVVDKYNKEMAHIDHIYEPNTKNNIIRVEVFRAQQASNTSKADFDFVMLAGGGNYLKIPSSDAAQSAVNTENHTTGILKLGNGLCLQKGTSTTETAADTRTISLNTAVGGVSYIVNCIVHNANTSPKSFTVTGLTTSSFSIKLDAATAADIDWSIIYF